MRDHGRLSTAFWASPDIKPLEVDAKLLAVFLIAGPHSNMAGVFRAPNGYVSDDLVWTIGRVSDGFRVLQERGFATRCIRTEWVVIHRYLKWNPVRGPKQIEGLMKVLRTIPKGSGVGAAAFQSLAEYVQGVTAAQREEMRLHLAAEGDTRTKPLPLTFDRAPIQGVGVGEGTGLKAGAAKNAPPTEEFPSLELEESGVERESEAPARTARAYSEAFQKRYGFPATMNAKVRGMLANFVQRVPWDEAPAVAAFYVQHNRKLYVDATHCVDLLLRDAEGLHLEFQRATKKGEASPTGNWWQSARGIEYMGKQKGIEPSDSFARFTAEVYVAMGEGPWMQKVDVLVQQHIDDVRRAAA